MPMPDKSCIWVNINIGNGILNYLLQSIQAKCWMKIELTRCGNNRTRVLFQLVLCIDILSTFYKTGKKIDMGHTSPSITWAKDDPGWCRHMATQGNASVKYQLLSDYIRLREIIPVSNSTMRGQNNWGNWGSLGVVKLLVAWEMLRWLVKCRGLVNGGFHPIQVTRPYHGFLNANTPPDSQY